MAGLARQVIGSVVSDGNSGTVLFGMYSVCTSIFTGSDSSCALDGKRLCRIFCSAWTYTGIKNAESTWTNEIAPIKQSVAVMVAMFGGWIYSVALCGIYLMWAYKIGMVIYLTIVAALTLLISAGLYTWIKKRGTEVFAAL